MTENHVKERIIAALKENSQGMSIQELSNALGVNRITVSKYVYGLMVENLIFQRNVGPVKLCCLKEKVIA